jgi:DNA-directed RNA polymerase specialized sigma subunit
METLSENSPLLQRLNIKATSLVARIEAVEDYIDSIDRSIVRQILTLRYVEGLTLKEIGAYVGYNAATITRLLKKHFMEAQDAQGKEEEDCGNT